jgi:hypothetical protein
MFQPGLWKQLNFYACIVPEGDILPVRSVYDNKSGTCNIGLNELYWKQPIWVAGPDLVASVLLSGRIPNVQQAFRVVPHGKQRGLQPIKLRGAISVDPRKEDFFTRAVEYRKNNKADDRLEHFLKILANSTSVQLLSSVEFCQKCTPNGEPDSRLFPIPKSPPAS